jgi:amino acid transporter
MTRPFLIEIMLFLAPFAAYALVLSATRRDARDSQHWRFPTLVLLAIIGLVLVAAGLVWFAHFGGAPPSGTYVPAHLEKGKLVPGQIK